MPSLPALTAAPTRVTVDGYEPKTVDAYEPRIDDSYAAEVRDA
jgi:hypothetical protein